MALIAQLGEHCTGIAEVVGSNPAQSLKIFSGLCSSRVALMTVITQLLLWDKLLSLTIENIAWRGKFPVFCLFVLLKFINLYNPPINFRAILLATLCHVV